MQPKETLKASIDSVTVADSQRFEALTIWPLLDGNGRSLTYVSLKRAVEHGWLRVEEVSKGGSVPELRVTNEGEQVVLILDGEELVGAKQNRIVNTSILVAAHTELIIPVSCIEQGRWSYTAPSFHKGDFHLSSSLRAYTASAVHESLKRQGSFEADQAGLWQAVETLQVESGVQSPTRALSDVYAGRRRDLEAYTENFELVQGQCGLAAAIAGEWVGLDVISRADVFSDLWPNLLYSYAFEAVLNEEPEGAEEGLDVAALLSRIPEMASEEYPAVGLGTIIRLESADAIGAALVGEGQAVHVALFRRVGHRQEKGGGMASASHRRGFRGREVS